MKLLSLVLCPLVASAALGQTPASSGQASCERVGTDGRYHIAWNLSASPRSYYWIQRLGAHPQRWQSLGELVTTARGTSAAAIEAGTLYRVFACNDPAATQDCTGTTVCWPALRPRTVNEIPGEMPDGHGQVMIVAKNTDLETQIQQYNVYRLIQLLSDIDLRTMPAMTPPRERDADLATGARLTPDDLLYLGVYENYDALRALALASAE